MPFIKRPAGASQEDASVRNETVLVCVARRERADNRTQSKPLDVCARPGILPAPNEVVPPPPSPPTASSKLSQSLALCLFVQRKSESLSVCPSAGVSGG